ncbi:MAG: alpha/beta hydrolase-fold protein [Thermomicrobiales bacterium]
MAETIEVATDGAGMGALESPRLNRLFRDLGAGNDGALAAFWAEIDAVGAPLIEPIPDEPGNRLVTFLWQESPEEPVENVVLLQFFSEGEPADKTLRHLAGTDVWYRSYRFMADVRIDYTFVVNDSLKPFHGPDVDRDEIRARMARAVNDPRNPATVVQPWMEIREDGYRADASILALPEAPPFVWKGRRDVPHGTIARDQFTSAILGNEREVIVYTHPGYEGADAPAALFIQFDGDQCLGVLDVANTLDNLHAEGKIGPVVALFVGNVDRGNELPCNADFANFLADELIPWARATYCIAPGPEAVIVSGQSYGGLAAMWAGLTRSDAVGNVLSQSGSFWWLPNPETIWGGDFPIGAAPLVGWLPTQAATWEPRPIRIWMEAGRLEATSRGPVVSLLESNRRMRDILIAKGYDVEYGEYAGGHDWFMWAEGLAHGLMHLAPASSE